MTPLRGRVFFAPNELETRHADRHSLRFDSCKYCFQQIHEQPIRFQRACADFAVLRNRIACIAYRCAVGRAGRVVLILQDRKSVVLAGISDQQGRALARVSKDGRELR